MRQIGAELTAARGRMGMSIEEVAKRTRVAAEYIEAIENEDWDAIPEGPYRDAWLRTYCSLVRVREPTVESGPPEPSGLPLWIPRLFGLVAVFCVLVLIAAIQIVPRLIAEPTVPVTNVPTQELKVFARRNAKITVRTDGELVFSKVLAGETEKIFKAKKRIEVEVPSVSVVRLIHNGISLIPQGSQDAPRTLVFVDDLNH